MRPVFVIDAPPAKVAGHGKHDVTTTQDEFVPENERRITLTLKNLGSAAVYFRVGSNATTADMPLEANEAFTIRAPGAVHMIAASGSQDVRSYEESR